VVNITTNKVVRLIGKSETHRFLNLALYQGAPRKKGIYTLAMAASDNAVIKEREALDPTLFCTAFKRNRFFMFSRRDPYT
jgi:peptidylprolyl isomerase domain and WD repeat-containing protein 1